MVAYRLDTKKTVSLTDSEVQTFLKEKPKVLYSVASELAFLSAENRQLEDLPLADFGRLPERLLLSARKKSIHQSFVNRKLRSLFIF